MLNVEIKYNPYTVKTCLTIGGVELKHGHEYMQICENRRLQDWIDSLLLAVYEGEQDGEINIEFKGLTLDGEDVKDAAKQLQEELKKKNIRLDISTRIEAKEADHKRTKALQQLFEEGKACPYPEVAQLFNTGKMQRAFEDAMNTIFEANVVATMSSGKSTFINSLLGQELLPAANRATTATIVRIINRDTMNDFRGQRFDKNGQPISDSDELITREKMTQWNADQETAFIDIEGDIPTINESDNITIAFIDTPGPNNSSNEDHYRKTIEAITSKPLSMVIYVLNATQLEIKDDKRLLSIVREAMEKGGRQAQDRFVFVVNKLDEFDPEREDIALALQKVKDYLQTNGIKNPLVIPVSALLALLLRKKRFMGLDSLTTKQKQALNNLSVCFLDIPEFNMLNYVRGDMNPRNLRMLEKMLDEADRARDDDRKAEILSGVPVVEMLLNDFLLKHAVPAKLKDAVDSFKILSDLENKIASTTAVLDAQQEELKKSIEILDGFRTSEERTKMAQEFRDKIKNEVYQISEKAEQDLQTVNTKAEKLISEVTDKLMQAAGDITQEQATELIDSTILLCKQFATENTVILTDSLEVEHISKINDMRHQYEEYAAKVLEKSFPDNSPLRKLQQDLMAMPDAKTLVDGSMKTKEKEVSSRRWVEPERKWYNPFSWFRSGYYVTDKKTVTVTFVDMQRIADEFGTDIRKFPQQIRTDFEEKAKENLKNAKDALLEVMAGIDAKMADISDKLKKAYEDEKAKESVIEESKKQLDWLNSFNQKLDNILAV